MCKPSPAHSLYSVLGAGSNATFKYQIRWIPESEAGKIVGDVSGVKINMHEEQLIRILQSEVGNSVCVLWKLLFSVIVDLKNCPASF